MSSDLEIRITYLEDQLNSMNLVLADQGRKIDELIDAVNRLNARFKALEEGSESAAENPFSPSEMPPDGINR